MPNYWLMKTEPDVFGILDLKKKGAEGESWDGVRNYQARNFMRDGMKLGDKVLFYHSRTKVPGVVGLAEVCKEAYPDHTSWDKKSQYFDEKSSPENPRWMMVDVKFTGMFKQIVSLEEMKKSKKLEGILVAKPGQRLSIQPVEKKHYDCIIKMGQ